MLVFHTLYFETIQLKGIDIGPGVQIVKGEIIYRRYNSYDIFRQELSQPFPYGSGENKNEGSSQTLT